MTDASQLQLAGEASRLLKAEQDDKALAILDRLVEAFPDHEEIVASRAFCLGKLGRFDEAYAVCDELSAANHTQRVEQLRTFLDARRAAEQKSNPTSDISARVLFPTLTVTSDESSRTLAAKLDSVRRNLEQEFGQFQQRELEAKSTIQNLEQRLRDRESSLAETKAQNDHLEQLLADISTEVAELQADSDVVLQPPRPLVLHQSETALAQSEEKLSALEQRIAEKDDTLSATFRKNAELEKRLSEIRKENEQLSDELADAVAHSMEPESLQILEDDKTALHERIGTLESVLEANEEDARKARRENDALRAEIGERERLLHSAKQNMETIQERLAAMHEQTERLLENDTLGAAQLEEVTLLVLDRDRMTEALAETASTLDDEVQALRSDRETLELAQSDIHKQLEQEQKDAQTRLTDLEKNFAATREALEQKSEQLEAFQASLHEQLSDTDSQRIDVENRLSQTEEALRAKETLIQRLEDDLQQKLGLIDEQQSLLTDHAERLHQVGDDAESNRTAAQAAQARIIDLETTVKLLDQHAADSEYRASELVKTQTELQSRTQVLMDEKTSLLASLYKRNRRVAELSVTYSTLAEDSSSTVASLQETQDALERTRAEAAALERDLESTRASLHIVTLENDTLAADLQAVQTELDERDTALTDAAAELQRLEAAREEAAQTNETLRAEQVSLRESYDGSAAKQAEYEALLTESENSAAALRDTIADQDGIIQAISLAKEKLDSELSESIGKIAEHLQLEENAAKIITDQQRQLTDRQQEIRALEADRQELEDTLRGTRSDLEEARRREYESTVEIDTFTEKLAALDGDLERRDETIADQESRIAEMQADAEEAREEIERLRANETDLTHRQENLQRKLDEALSQEIDSRERIGELEHFLDETRHQKDEVTADLGVALETAAQTDARIEVMRIEISTLTHEKETLLSDHGQISGELQQTHTARQDAETTVAELTETVAELRRQVVLSESNLEDALGALQDREAELEKQIVSLEKAHQETDRLRQALDRVQPDLQHMRTWELPEALEQKVRALREVQTLRAEVELLRRQLW